MASSTTPAASTADTPTGSDATLAADSAPPLATGNVEGIFIAEEAGGPMQSLPEAKVVQGRGIFGDRYCKRKGTYSVFRASKLNPGQREPGRQLTLVSAEGAEAAFKANGMEPLESLGMLRRNVVVRGIPGDVLQDAIGRRIRLGDEVVVFAHRPTVPCMYNERKMDRPGFVESCWDVAGVSCEVLVGGQLRAGDAVRIDSALDVERIDEGKQSAGYFIRPSQRSKAMRRNAALALAATLPRLLETDPGGVVRAIESYQTVGLKLFQRPKRFRRAEALQDRFLLMVGIFVVLIAFLLASQKAKDVWDEDGWDDWWRNLVHSPAAPLPPPPQRRRPWWKLF
jgi:MOSC domain-containing protein YiiM